jgi:hypothetical protein
MFPACTTAGGTCFAFPDVCLVPAPPGPPVPTPFPNNGQCAQATGTVDAVVVQGHPVLVQSSRIPMSTGDEIGVNGGVVSGMNLGEITFKTGSTKIRAKGKRVVLLTTPSAHNGSNANAPMGCVQSASQTKVQAGG